VIEGSDRVFVLREGQNVAEINRKNLTETSVMLAMATGEATRELIS
jgi:ABC-type sugar transport system ATPase subunit